MRVAGLFLCLFR